MSMSENVWKWQCLLNSGKSSAELGQNLSNSVENQATTNEIAKKKVLWVVYNFYLNLYISIIKLKLAV